MAKRRSMLMSGLKTSGGVLGWRRRLKGPSTLKAAQVRDTCASPCARVRGYEGGHRGDRRGEGAAVTHSHAAGSHSLLCRCRCSCDSLRMLFCVAHYRWRQRRWRRRAHRRGTSCRRRCSARARSSRRRIASAKSTSTFSRRRTPRATASTDRVQHTSVAADRRCVPWVRALSL